MDRKVGTNWFIVTSKEITKKKKMNEHALIYMRVIQVIDR